MSGPIQDALSGAFDRHSGSAGRVAVVGAEAITYDGLRDRIEDAVRALREVLPGDTEGSRHIGFCLGNRPGYVVLYFATLYAGHLPLLLDANFNTGEIESIRNDCGLDALVVEPGKAGAIAFRDDAGLLPLEPREPAFRPRPDTQVCRFTSGTTGRPKCLEFSGHAVVSAARNWVLGTGMTGDDRTLALAALSNGLAFNTSLLSTFLAGAQIHFLKGLPLTRPVARRIAESGITRLVAFPTLYRNFVAPGGPDASEMASLKHAISAGAPLWPDVREEFRNRYGLDISDYYGIAETGPVTFERDPNHHAGLGEPLPGVELRIASNDAGNDEPGEVLVRTGSMASGYLNHPGLFEGRVGSEGFYHSGDRGRIVDRRLHLVGRTQDHINVAGRKIDPTEIVAVVTAMDGVLDAVAFPDEDLNRETLVHLVVVSSIGSKRGLTKADVAEACRSRLAPWKVPGRVSFVDEIPRTGIGKPRIAVLREQLLQRKEPVA